MRIVDAMQSSTSIVVEKVEGATIWDKDGKSYLDFAASSNNLPLGHNPPRIIDAIKNYLTNNKPVHLSSRYIDPVTEKFIKRIGECLPRELSRINVKLSDGSDAVEECIKRTLEYQTGTKIIVFQGAHHGETIATIAASPKHHGNAIWHKNLEDHFFAVENFAPLEQIEELLKQDSFAGILLEPVLVNFGVLPPPENYLQHLRVLCDKYKKTLIFDEVQTGFGWLGKFTAAEYFGVIPDIAAFGKGLGNGFPIAITAMKPEYDNLAYNQTGFTAGGTPLSLLAAINCIDTLEEYLPNVKLKAYALRYNLNQIPFPFILRQAELMVGVDFNCIAETNNVFNRCVENGLVLRKSGNGKSLIWKPPVTVTIEEITNAVSIFRKSLY